MSYKCTLIKIESNHNNLRTNEMEGVCTDLPEVGKRFLIFGEGLEFGHRVITTTRVQEVEGHVFRTKNSTYELINIVGTENNDLEEELIINFCKTTH